MTMRKKDYKAIGRLLGVEAETWQQARGTTRYDESECDGAILAIDHLADSIADYCATQDPTFKRERFLADCGVSHD